MPDLWADRTGLRVSCIEFISDPAEVWALHERYEGKLAFDVGANGGGTAAIYSKHFERVIAFEPCQESYMDLALATMTYHRNVTADNRAISAHDGEIRLYESAHTERIGQLASVNLGGDLGIPTGTRLVECVTIDSAAELYGTPDFIKIDVEGHETDVLLGGRDVLKLQPALLLEVHGADLLEQCLSLLHGAGYSNLGLYLNTGYPAGHELAGGHVYLTAGIE
jgi:FkbM family methyltransferase